jgi:hypothetical protein
VTAKLWEPKPEWVGKTAVVVATGPSLTLQQVRAIALARLADRCRVIAINESVLPCWFADIAFGGDGKWWEARHGLPRFPDRKVQLDPAAPPPREGMLLVQRVGPSGYDGRPGYVYTHRNSGAMAVQIADMHKPDRILLVAFDMREVEGRRHWFDRYEDRLNSTPDIGRWVREFRALQTALAGRLFNTTPGSALDFVPFTDLEMALNSA